MRGRFLFSTPLSHQREYTLELPSGLGMQEGLIRQTHEQFEIAYLTFPFLEVFKKKK